MVDEELFPSVDDGGVGGDVEVSVFEYGQLLRSD